MPQDWFAANAPKKATPPPQAAGDWFAANAPTPAASPAPVGTDWASAANAEVGRRLLDVVKGAKAGVASTVFHGGDLLRRAVGLDRIIDKPEVQEAITPPQTGAGKTGFFLEQGAEFAVPLTRAANAARGLPWLARRGVDAATSAGVAGIQSGGDADAMATGAVAGAVLPPVVSGAVTVGRAAVNAGRRAAAGAAEGGVGGAVAAFLRSAAPLEPTQMVVQALKPRSVRPRFRENLGRALPELKITEQELGRPIQSVEDLIEATKLAKQRIRAQYDQMAGPQRAMGSTVDLSPVADAMEKSIPSKVKLEDPRRAGEIVQRADLYRRRFDLADAEQLLKETNAELEAFYNKYPPSQRRALTSNPEIAHLNAQASELRKAIYGTLDAPGQGAAARELNRRYGSILEVEEEAFRRLNVAQRQQPESLAEQIAGAGAVADLARGTWKIAHGNLMGAADIASARAQRAAAKYLKEQQTTDALIKRAFAAFDGRPVPVVMPPQRTPIAALPPGPIVTPPPPDPSFVRAVPAVPAVSGRPRMLPGSTARVPPAPPDPSFVRAEPAVRAVSSRPRTLPPHREPIITPPPAEPTPPAPKGRAKKEPLTIPAKRVEDPETGKVSYVTDPAGPATTPITADERDVLKTIADELDTFRFERKIRNESLKAGGGVETEWMAGAGGTPLHHAIAPSGVARADVAQKVRAFLEKGEPSVYADRALTIARARIANATGHRRPAGGAVEFPKDQANYPRPILPSTIEERAAAAADEADRAQAFFDDVDDVTTQPSKPTQTREPGEEGRIAAPLLVATGAGVAAIAALERTIKALRDQADRGITPQANRKKADFLERELERLKRGKTGK